MIGFERTLSENEAGMRPASDTLNCIEFSSAAVEVRLTASCVGLNVTPLSVGRVSVVPWLPIALSVMSERVVAFDASCLIIGATRAEETKLTNTKTQPMTAVQRVQVQGQHMM
jgi:hypothetical protein